MPEDHSKNLISSSKKNNVHFLSLENFFFLMDDAKFQNAIGI